MTNRCPLLQFGFWRVVLDEAQLVATTSSVAAQMTSSLWRRHAWVVTGTPITARLEEIQVKDMQHHPMRYAWVVTGTPPHCTPFEEIQAWDMQHHPSINNVHPMRILQFWLLRYLYNTELPGTRPRAFLSSDFHCKMGEERSDISASQRAADLSGDACDGKPGITSLLHTQI